MTALDGVIEYSDRLKERTDDAFQRADPPRVERVTYQMGLRGRRVLQSAREIARREWDDVVGNLSRSIVEIAVELDYLHKPVDERSPEDKASLYECHAIIVKEQIGEKLDDHLKVAHTKCVEFRAKHGVNGHTWHGRRVTGRQGDSILERLGALGEEGSVERRRAANLLKAYRVSSYFEHNNAHQKFYLERLDTGYCRVLEAKPHVGPISSVVLGGSEILWVWGGVLGISAEDRYAGLQSVEIVQRKDHDLGPDDPMP